MHFYLLSRISTLFHHLWKVSLSYSVKFSDRFLSKGFPIYLNCDQLPSPWNKTQQLQHHVVGTMCSSQHIQCQTLTLYVLRWYIQCLTHTVSDTVSDTYSVRHCMCQTDETKTHCMCLGLIWANHFLLHMSPYFPLWVVTNCKLLVFWCCSTFQTSIQWKPNFWS